jgi:hypothetical protein
MPNYSFNSATLPNVATVATPYSSRISSAETPSRPGGYAGQQFAAERKISLTGTLTASSYSALQTAWSDLLAANDVSVPAQLVVRDNWYYLATCESIADSERDVTSIQYDATYVCADPVAFSTTLSTPTLPTTGGTITSVAGNKPALPALTLTVSAAPASSYLTVTNTTTSESFVLFPDATGVFVIDSLAESCKVGTTDKMACFQGRFISLRPGSNTLTIATSGGAALSAASINYRARAI